LTPADRAAGYWWELSMRQVEFSRTIVFTAPRHARAFFETLVADNLDLGRPEQVEVIFGRKIHRQRRSTKRPQATRPDAEVFTTAIDRANQGVTVNIFSKHSRVKQYLKDGQALRIETPRQRHHRSGRAAPTGALRRTIGQGTCNQPPNHASSTSRPGQRPCESSL
jgi:hypothetical protein